MTRFQHILVLVDFEEASQEALEMAIELARAFDAKLSRRERTLSSWECMVDTD